MARIVDNFCVECDVCRHCGRDKDVIHYECDSCGADNIDGETRIFSDGAYHYCIPCLIRANMSDFIEYAENYFSEEFAERNYAEVEEVE